METELTQINCRWLVAPTSRKDYLNYQNQQSDEPMPVGTSSAKNPEVYLLYFLSALTTSSPSILCPSFLLPVSLDSSCISPILNVPIFSSMFASPGALSSLKCSLEIEKQNKTLPTNTLLHVVLPVVYLCSCTPF